MLLADRQNILEIRRKVFDDLEKTRGEKCWQFREDVFGDLEKTYLAIFGKKCVGDLEKSLGDIGEKPFSDNVRDLEKRGRRGYGDFVLEFAME